MKHGILTVVVLWAMLPAISVAQHCPFDFSWIIVVEARDTTGQTIPDLRITLLDSLQQPVKYSRWTGRNWIEDTLRFWLNPPKTTGNRRIDNENPMEPEHIRFWFARDNYVVVTGLYHKIRRYILVEDTVNGRYAPAIIPITPEYCYPLCGSYSHWDLGEKYGFVKNYKPLHITLEQRATLKK